MVRKKTQKIWPDSCFLVWRKTEKIATLLLFGQKKDRKRWLHSCSLGQDSTEEKGEGRACLSWEKTPQGFFRASKKTYSQLWVCGSLSAGHCEVHLLLSTTKTSPEPSKCPLGIKEKQMVEKYREKNRNSWGDVSFIFTSQLCSIFGLGRFH